MELCKELPYKPNSDDSLVMGLWGSSKAIKFLPVAAEPLIFTVTIDSYEAVRFQDYCGERARNRTS